MKKLAALVAVTGLMGSTSVFADAGTHSSTMLGNGHTLATISGLHPGWLAAGFSLLSGMIVYRFRKAKIG
jgi:hypothetical protein